MKDQPVNSSCVDGIRLIPVELIDCAGLVPGAWQGRGLGNQFLDEIRKADALIQIVDAAGATDIEGRLCEPGTHDPVKDVEFLDREIAMWLFQIVKKDWEKISRRAEGAKEDITLLLEDRLSGLAIKRSHIVQAVKKCDLDKDKPTSWTDDNLISFLHVLRAISKPMIIAANKIDLPHAEENVERLRKTGYTVVPCCAEAEMALRRAAEKGLVSYKPGDTSFSVLRPEALTAEQKRGLEAIRERVLTRWKTTGVQDSINIAYFNLLNMITVYPVEDLDKLADHKGRTLPDVYLVPPGTTARQFAYVIHTELGEGFLYAIEARSKMRVGEEYLLKDRDVISIISTRKRA